MDQSKKNLGGRRFDATTKINSVVQLSLAVVTVLSLVLVLGLVYGATDKLTPLQTGENQQRSPSSTDKPNIIFIIGDDHGWPYFGFMGDQQVKTPNLDKLAAEGTVFPYGFTTSSVCPYSLRGLLTGLHYVQWKHFARSFYRSGLKERNGEHIKYYATLPRLLREHGYVSFQGGKYWDGYYAWAGFTDGVTLDGSVGGKLIGRKTMKPLWTFLEKNRHKPFYVWFAPALPHLPFNAHEKYRKPYKDKGYTEGAVEYYANISWFDDLLGQLLDYLEEKRLRRKTLLIYISDNGWEQDAQQKKYAYLGGPKGKLSMHELGFRSPIIFNWPGRIKAGRVYDHLVSAVDLVPTALDFAGVAIPEGILKPEYSLHPLLTETGIFTREAVVGTQDELRVEPPPGLTPFELTTYYQSDKWFRREQAHYYRTKQWRYIWYVNSNVEELYHISDDPRELHNVIDRHPSVAKDMRFALEQWLAAARKNVPDPVRDIK